MGTCFFTLHFLNFFFSIFSFLLFDFFSVFLYWPERVLSLLKTLRLSWDKLAAWMRAGTEETCAVGRGVRAGIEGIKAGTGSGE